MRCALAPPGMQAYFTDRLLGQRPPARNTNPGGLPKLISRLLLTFASKNASARTPDRPGTSAESTAAADSPAFHPST